MEAESGWTKLGAGALAGLAAAVLMALIIFLLRLGFGVATPPELVADRMAPLLGMDILLKMLARLGGYNQLKQLGAGSVIAGQLVVGVIGGLLHAFALARDQARRPGQGRRALIFVALFIGALWLLSLALLWPALGAHYHGLPPAWATFVNILALLFSYTAYGAALIFFHRLLTKRAEAAADEPAGRRAILVGGIGAGLALACGLLLSRLYRLATFSYDGLRYMGPDVQPITPNDRFYAVTKNIIDPRVELSLWRLEITGLVNRSRAYGFDELKRLPAVTQETTLRCISNQVGDGLISNAVWKGVPLRSLIEAAAPRPGVVEVLLHAVDGYTDTFSIAKAMEPTTLVVYEMNGQPLPSNHGYPARVIAPGLYGEKSVKWVTRVELVNRDARGFYEQQGWGPNFVVPTTARFDQPADKQRIKLAAVSAPLKGIAHGGQHGIAKVEVSFDNGNAWREAKIDYTSSPLAWVLWSYDWRPARAGEYKLAVRATNGKGELQTAEERGFAPQGATGYHRIAVNIED